MAARVVKALDKLETMLQPTQGDNPADFDYAFNLDYGCKHTDAVLPLCGVRQAPREPLAAMTLIHTDRADFHITVQTHALARHRILHWTAHSTPAKSYLRTWREQGVGIAEACIGTFVVADSGLLDGEEATTPWSLAPLFRERYPTVKLSDSRMVVESNGLVMAGAAMGHLDLALWFVRQASPELASHGCNLDTAATEVGYADASSLRSLLRRKLGRTVKELRSD
ncbi:AraC family transcriptional regulator [Pandoraea anapnoica]|uniref:AraC family transcriptional regulator n=1 Tax=Pandoraea anapnoica TaxID=2508301 RepID=A0A5E4ZV31_9BURK|nr:hypothetical protein [Pandoraea anapnoica]VVE64163.1 AraC family transcriptional regulator [Pandoraea anapnoica]